MGNIALKGLEGIASLMEERGVRQEDVQAVIACAEQEGAKMYREEGKRCLGKKRLENFTAYVEYGIEEDGYRLFNVYGHRVSLSEDQ